MNVDEAVKAAAIINPKIAVPVHHLKADPNVFQHMLEKKLKIKVILAGIGESLLI
jgi:L-ascorbate metabolism protein UlaG (beta-lactamase superfamily)